MVETPNGTIEAIGPHAARLKAFEEVNAVVVVCFQGIEIPIALDGTELSETTQPDGSVHRYLTTASRDFIGDQVAAALVELKARADV